MSNIFEIIFQNNKFGVVLLGGFFCGLGGGGVLWTFAMSDLGQVEVEEGLKYDLSYKRQENLFVSLFARILRDNHVG